MFARLATMSAALILCLAAVPARGQDPPAPEGEPAKPAADASPPDKPAEKPAEAPAAQEPAPASPPAEHRGPSDPAELAAFFDGILDVQLKDKHIGGATLAVVVDSKPFFSKGYGYADVAAKKKVDPAATMFRIGSVTKLFTWTAVMQLVDEGKLDLDADINTYLDFTIPATFPEPITLAHLLAHTPGFEDHELGLFAKSADELEPLGSILARQIPARVRPPGELASYSNHGTALAGYIVARVSGMSWEDYVEQKILDPLGMTHTMVRQPPEDKMPADMSKGYKFQRGRYRAEGFEYVRIAPAGSMSASADDMAKFIIAHLQDGRYNAAQILQEKTARRMRELLFTHDEALDGMAYGFMRMSYNGETVIHHGGDTFLFHSLLVLLPERKTGLFVSYNTDTATTVRQPLLEAFLDHYFPAAEAPAKEDERKKSEPAKPAESLARFEGDYGGIRHSYTSMTKLGALFNVLDVSADEGELVVGGPAGPPERFVEIEPLLFREIDGQDKLAFRQDEHGNITHLFVGRAPYMAFEKLQWNERPVFVLALVGGCAAVFLSAVFGWPWAAFIAWGVPREQTAFSRMASWFGWFMSLTALAWMGTVLYVLSDHNELAFGMTREVQSLLWASPLIAGLVALVALGALAAWIRGYWRFSARLHYTLVLAAGLSFVWFLHEWNLLWLPQWLG